MATLIPPYELAQTIGDATEIEASSVKELLAIGSARWGEPFDKAVRTSAIVVNGRAVNHLKGGRTRLKDGDTVWLLKPSSGG